MTLAIFKDTTSPSLSATIRSGGVASDLSGSTVKFRMRLTTDDTLVVDANATVVSASSTLAANVSLPESAIAVADASGFLPSGALLIDGEHIVEYEEISGDVFLGCSGGAGAASSGDAVAQLGGVRYDWVAGDVDTVGDYSGWWRITLPSTKVQETPEFDIRIIEHAPVASALCSLEDIQAFIPGYLPHSDRATDGILREMISATSVEIQNQIEREVLPYEPNPYAKVFDLSAYDASERRLWIGELASTTDLDVVITQADGTAVATLEDGDAELVALPRNRKPWQPFSRLTFPAGLANSPTLAEGYVVTVTGDWGFPVVPADLKLACVKLVIVRYLRDAAVSGTSFADAVADAGFDLSAAFASARDVIESYSIYSLA